MISPISIVRPLLVSLILFLTLVSSSSSELLITEFMASNRTTLTTIDGDTPDWIELHNSGQSAVNLADYALSNDRLALHKWPLPAGALRGGEYRIVYASNKDLREPAGEWHTNFKLSSTAGYLSLTQISDNRVLSEYEYSEQLQDVSFGLAQTGNVEALTLLPEGSACRFLVPTNSVNDWQSRTFSDANWRSATTAVGYERSSGYQGLLGANADVERFMFDTTSSVYVRVPFQVNSKQGLIGLTLRMKYDDGFVAYLNGEQVASANAPNAPAWNSTATDQHDDGAAVSFQDFSLNNDLDQLRIGNNVLAIHGLNRNNTSSDLLLMPAVQALRQQEAQIGDADFFLNPSPGSPNGTAQGLPAGPVTFSIPGQSFTGTRSLSLSNASPSAVIRYTTNGNLPTSNSTQFSAPINITSSTLVRARAFEPNKAPGPIGEQAYLKLTSNVRAFSSNLPVVVLDRLGSNESASNGKSSVFWSIFEPSESGGRTQLLGNYSMGTRAGYKVRGSSSTGFAKKSWSIEAWNENNANKNVSPLNMPSESDWILSGRYTFDRALMRNPVMYTLSNQIGRYAVRTRFVEVYLNTNGGDVQSSDYHGVYTLMEKISRDNDRVDVERLPEGIATEPGITGGYMLKIDRSDPGDNGFAAAGQSLRYVYPKEEDVTVDQANWIRGYMNDFGSALNGPNFADPVLGYEKYIDVDSFIDHHLLNVLSLNADALRLSTYMFKPRDRKLQMGPIWDFDRSLESTDGRDDNPKTWQGGTSYFNYPWWNRLFADENFWQRYIDRYVELRQSAFSTSNIHGIIDGFARELNESQVRNFQRWPAVSPRFGSYQGEVNHLKDWLETRLDWMDSQFLEVPNSNRTGGILPADTQVQLSSPLLSGGRQIRYTLDGSDPRPFSKSTVLEGSNLLDKNASVRALVPISDIGTTWRTSADFIDSSWVSGKNGVGYDDNTTYNPYINVNLEGTNAMKGVNTSAYMRLKFQATAQQVATFNFMSLQMRYDDGFVAYLNGTKIAEANAPESVAWNSEATGTNDDGAAVTFEDFDAPQGLSALRVGTNLLAIHGLNAGSTSSDFLMQAKIIAGERKGSNTDVEAQTYTGPITLTESTILTARVYDPAGANSVSSRRVPVGSPWSAPLTVRYLIDEIPANANNLVVSEFIAKAHEFIELQNIGTQRISLNGVQLSGGVAFTFPDHSLNPGEYAIVANNVTAFRQVYGDAITTQILGEYQGKLGNGGDAFSVLDANDSLIQNVSYELIEDAAPLGTPGSVAATAPLQVRVEEVLSNSEPPAVDAIELHNLSDSNADISSWFLTDDLGDPRQFQLPNGTILAPNGYLVFTEDQFDSFALSSAGDDVFLLATDSQGRFDGRLDHFSFAAAPIGTTYGRIDTTLAETHVNLLETPSLGQANSRPRVGPLVFTELMIHPNAEQSEFIEIANIEETPIDLTNIQINGAGFTFESGTLPAKATLLLTADQFTARLDNSGETLTIFIPDPTEPQLLIPSDQVTYQTTAPWPVVNGNGLTLERRALDAFGSDPNSWTTSAVIGGTPGTHADLVEPVPTGNDWKFSFFSGTELENPAVSGDMGDPDGDGLANMLEYVLGRDPRKQTAEPVVVPDYASFDGQRRLRLRYTVRTSLPFHRVVLESSSDLLTWENTSEKVTYDEAQENPDGTHCITAYWLATSSDHIYLRLRVGRLD